jgi:hypothetical protein
MMDEGGGWRRGGGWERGKREKEIGYTRRKREEM